MEIVFITTNSAKVEWANSMLKGYAVTFVQKPLNLEEGRSLDVEEIVRHKATQAMQEISVPFIINDTGFYIEALNGFPASQIRLCLSTIGIPGLLKLMDGVGERQAYFKSALAFVEKRKVKTFSGKYAGEISHEQFPGNTRGWSPLLEIFIPKGHSKTPSQMSDREWEGYQKSFSKIDPYMQFFNWLKRMWHE